MPDPILKRHLQHDCFALHCRHLEQPPQSLPNHPAMHRSFPPKQLPLIIFFYRVQTQNYFSFHIHHGRGVLFKPSRSSRLIQQFQIQVRPSFLLLIVGSIRLCTSSRMSLVSPSPNQNSKKKKISDDFIMITNHIMIASHEIYRCTS